MHIRVIPSLTIHNNGLVKSEKFKNYKYIGDPINAVKIFNEKEVDELALIDISATKNKKGPNIKHISEIVSEAFMPVSYGGGITTLDEIKALLFNGVEKVILNKIAHTNPKIIEECAKIFGSQSVIVSIDVSKNIFGNYQVYTDNSETKTKYKPEEFAKHVEQLGAGEILLNDINKDGTFSGYDINLIQRVSSSINIPLISLGGAKTTNDFSLAKKAGASAVAAGSMFVYMNGDKNSILINYPSQEKLKEI